MEVIMPEQSQLRSELLLAPYDKPEAGDLGPIADTIKISGLGITGA